MTRNSGFLLLALFLPFAGCSDGGDERRPVSEVKLTDDSAHVVGLLGRLEFASFPVIPIEVTALNVDMDFTETRYELLNADAEVVQRGEYALAEDATLSVFQERENASTLIYGGAYGLEGDTDQLFFTDRITDNVGLYFGIPKVEADANTAGFSGDWHIFSMHAILPTFGAPDETDVGRAFAGSATIAVDGTLTGDGSESVDLAATTPLTGTFESLAGSEATLSLDYDTVTRTFEGGAVGDIMAFAGLDEENERATGVCLAMRHRATAVDADSLAGVYRIGILEFYVDPDDAGFDSILGTLQINADSEYLITGRDNSGTDVVFGGNLTAEDSGALRFTRGSETWLGAVSQDYGTIVILDNEAGTTPSLRGVLRLMFALRVPTGV